MVYPGGNSHRRYARRDEIQGESLVIAEVRAQASGEFEFKNIPEGEYSVVASGYTTQIVAVTGHDLTNLSLKPAPAGAGVPPNLVDKDLYTLTGKACERCRVIAIPEPFAESLDHASLPQTTSDKSGNYTLDNLAAGTTGSLP